MDQTRVYAQSTARLWHLPSLLDDDLPRITVWVETITGLAVSDEGRIYGLDAAAWLERRERLDTLGGPPKADSGWLLDPVLYGTDPTARARAWIERRRWPEAEAALTDAVRARPLRRSVWIERGRFYVLRSEPEKAATDFAKALALGDRGPRLLADIAANGELLDRVLQLLRDQETTLLFPLLLLRADRLARQGRLEAARNVLVRVVGLPREEDERSTWRLLGLVIGSPWEGDERPTWRLNVNQMFALLGCSDVVASLIHKHRHASNIGFGKANSIAWCSALAPGAGVDRETAVRLAEVAVKALSADGSPAQAKAMALKTLGAALYRAGRFEDAIRRLDDGIRLRGGVSIPQEWAFLAMAHHRLGHREDACRWLDRIRDRQRGTDPDQYWEELGIQLLRSEAEAVILYDPVFPADPFAQ